MTNNGSRRLMEKYNEWIWDSSVLKYSIQQNQTLWLHKHCYHEEWGKRWTKKAVYNVQGHNNKENEFIIHTPKILAYRNRWKWVTQIQSFSSTTTPSNFNPTCSFLLLLQKPPYKQSYMFTLTTYLLQELQISKLLPKKTNRNLILD